MNLTIPKERDVVKFLEDNDGEASLDEISEGLKMPKYGPNSVYATLRTLRIRGIAERKSDKWILSNHVVLEIEQQKDPSENRSLSEEAYPNGTVKPNSSQMIESITRTFKEAMSGLDAQTQRPNDSAATMERHDKILELSVIQPDSLSEIQKTLSPLRTETFLDDLFFTLDGEKLNGVPSGGQFMIAGPHGAGKSLLVEEIALRKANSGKKTFFVTLAEPWKSPTERFDLQTRMKQRADNLGLDWNNIRSNLSVIEAILNQESNDAEIFAETCLRIIEMGQFELTILDSVNSFASSGKDIMNRILRANMREGLTAFMVEQIANVRQNNYEPLGDNQISPNIDGTILMGFAQILLPGYVKELHESASARFLKVLHCRLCDFDESTIQIYVTAGGLVRPLGI